MVDLVKRRSPSGTIFDENEPSFIYVDDVTFGPYIFAGPFPGATTEATVAIWPFPLLADGEYEVVVNNTLESDDDWMLQGLCMSHVRITQYDLLNPPGSPPGTNGIVVALGMFCRPLLAGQNVNAPVFADLLFLKKGVATGWGPAPI